MIRAAAAPTVADGELTRACVIPTSFFIVALRSSCNRQVYVSHIQSYYKERPPAYATDEGKDERKKKVFYNEVYVTNTLTVIRAMSSQSDVPSWPSSSALGPPHLLPELPRDDLREVAQPSLREVSKHVFDLLGVALLEEHGELSAPLRGGPRDGRGLA